MWTSTKDLEDKDSVKRMAFDKLDTKALSTKFPVNKFFAKPLVIIMDA